MKTTTRRTMAQRLDELMDSDKLSTSAYMHVARLVRLKRISPARFSKIVDRIQTAELTVDDCDIAAWAGK